MVFDAGLLLMRLATGLIIAAHGAHKLFGWFGGPGIVGTEAMMAKFNLRPAKFWALVAGLVELVGGLLTATGLFMPLGPILIIADMLGALYYVHLPNGFWNYKGGYEWNLCIGAVALGLGMTGAGAYALDRVFQFALPEPETLLVGLAVVVIGFGITLLISRRVPPTLQQPTPQTR